MLLIGPPGSGKTHWVLERLETAVREGRGDRVRLITPTASMARHLLHELARRGLTVPGDLAMPISRAVEKLTPNVTAPSASAVRWLLGRAVAQKGERLGPSARTPGGLRRLARAVDDLEAARVSPGTLREQAQSPFERGLAETYAQYEQFLKVQGFVSAGERRFRAAEEAAIHGFPRAEEVYFDGFFDFSPGERDLVRSLAAAGCSVTATLPAAPPEGELSSFNRERLEEVRRPAPAPETFVAPTMETEVSEIARRILEARAGGRPLREIGLVVRSPERYASTIQAVFERYGIPFRSRRPLPVSELEPVGFLRDLLAAASEGFPGEATLAALERPASRAAAAEGAVNFVRRMREAAPFEGLEFLVEQAGETVRPALEELREAAAEWATPAAPGEWVVRMARLAETQTALPASPEGSSMARALERRAFGAGLSAWRAAAEEAAETLAHKGRAEAGFEEWREALETALDEARVTVADDRREVVNVLSAYEARQWELPVVFVCGMVEGWFPAAAPEDVYLNDRLRRRLKKAGLPVRRQQEILDNERMLFRIATTRASESLTLSYPELDEASAPLLRSFFLPPAPEDGDRAAFPVVPEEEPADDPADEGARIDDGALQAHLAERHAHFSPSGLNDFLRCPFEFFAKKTLKLKARPAAVTERLDALAKGSILHEALAEWSKDPSRPIGVALDGAFARKLEELKLTPTFLTAVTKAALRSDLERFVTEPESRPFAAATGAELEDEIEYVIEREDGSAKIFGRIDRFETLEGDTALVVDYKSGTAQLKELAEGERDGTKLQGVLYLAGLRRDRRLAPGGTLYIGLRGATQIAGTIRNDILQDWNSPKTVERRTAAELAELVDQAEARTVELAGRIRSGDIEVTPTDRRHCEKFCDFRDVCRVRL